MAEKQQKKDIEETVEVTEKEVSANSIDAAVVKNGSTRKWIIIIVVAALILYIVALILGASLYRSWTDRHNDIAQSRPHITQHFGQMRGFGERTFVSQSSNSDGLTTTTTTTTYTQTQGVVTAVNADSIVVAGGGKTQTIKTDSDTTYTDDTKPKVNDTIVVVGTKDGDTITATQVAVYNY